ncbi:MAG: hypothetical protein AMXMBFR84_20270 [Candidatus Hydrogenedentota bacterium]
MPRSVLALWAMGIVCTISNVWAEDNEPGQFSVIEFGAVGDGSTDATAAFQKALDTAGGSGGVVRVPLGNYLIAGTLSVPADVTLEGVWTGPPRSKNSKGSTLLATAGKGEVDGVPFITLHESSMLKGLVVFYPDQVDSETPHAYPWTVRGIGDNCTITDTLLVNPYQGVDFGTYPAGRHFIRALYMQALYKGIFVDKCFDVGRIEDAHIWPFWSTEGPVRKFTEREGIAFLFGRTDWEYVSNSFCIGYKIGFHFDSYNDGPGNVLVTQSGSDVGPCAVRVEQVQAHSGITFANCQMMAGIEVGPDNRGPVKFTATGFWPIDSTSSHAILEGKGHTFFEACNFSDWDKAKTGAACIVANNDGLTVTGCDFMAEGKAQIQLGENVQAAIITSNRLRGGAKIENLSKGDVQIGLNTER